MKNEARKLRMLEALVEVADRPTRTWISSNELAKRLVNESVSKVGQHLAGCEDNGLVVKREASKTLWRPTDTGRRAVKTGEIDPVPQVGESDA